MRTICLCVARGEEIFGRYFLSHYTSFCSEVIVWDAGLHHSFIDLALHGDYDNVEIRPWKGSDEMDDIELVEFSNQAYREFMGKADYVILPDADELIYAHNIIDRLTACKVAGVDVPVVRGFQMLLDKVPTEDGQAWEHHKLGVEDNVYSKKIVINPAIDISFVPGKHDLRAHGPCKFGDPSKPDLSLKLLHFRCLGLEYVQQRNQANRARVSKRNKDLDLGFHCKPGWTGMYSDQWWADAMNRRVDVVS